MQQKKRLVFPFLAVLTVVAGALLSACGESTTEETGTDAEATASSEDGLTIAEPWSRQPAEGQTVAAAYGMVSNNTDADVQILGVTSPVSDNLELHETSMDDAGVMSMSEVSDGFTVPAGGSFTFEPGGPHIMIFDIDAATYPTDVVTFTLALDNGDELTFDAEVRKISTMNDGEMDQSETGDGDMN